MSEPHLGPLEPSDVRQLARLHARAFPAFFLSTLGEPFLTQFYRGFLKDPTAVTVVARDEAGKVQGAVVGTVEPAGFFGRLLRRRLLGFAAASARAAVRRPTSVPRLLRAVSYRGDAPSGDEGALLSSICVDPDRQSSGLGGRLLGAWEDRAAASGAQTAFLTTDAERNEAVNAFYRGRGWVLADSYRTPEGRSMNRYTKRLVQR